MLSACLLSGESMRAGKTDAAKRKDWWDLEEQQYAVYVDFL